MNGQNGRLVVELVQVGSREDLDHVKEASMDIPDAEDLESCTELAVLKYV